MFYVERAPARRLSGSNYHVRGMHLWAIINEVLMLSRCISCFNVVAPSVAMRKVFDAADFLLTRSLV